MRLTADVLVELREKMDEVVVSYPPHIYRVEGPPIIGTAFFPGGCGLWCGLEYFAPPPRLFPESPVMFVAHNYSSANAFQLLRTKGGEAGSWWRDRVVPLLRVAGIDPARAFFTNALMGLKDGESTGSMNATEQFESECSSFLLEQLRIVKPTAVVAFGGDAYPRVRRVFLSVLKCMHPSAREFNRLETRAERIGAAASDLRAALDTRLP